MVSNRNYKNILNTFVGNSKSYGLDVKNRLKNLFLYNSMGLVEELMYSRHFYTGDLGNGFARLVGVPKTLIDRISNNYTTLKAAISAETTTIQTNFNTLSPNNDEKQYIKNTLNSALEEQLVNINNELLQIINSFRRGQHNLTTTADKLNFITTNSYDGYFLNPFGGRVTALQLTSTTVVTSLTNAYNTESQYISDFISNHVTPTFTKGYPGGNEYIFFSNKMYTNESLAFRFSGNYKLQLKTLLRYRNGNLYDKLLKIDNTSMGGITEKTHRGFEVLLNNIINPWMEYDISLLTPRITNGIENGYSVLDGQLTEYVSDFNIEYGINTGATAETLVRNNLLERQGGVVDNKFNFKLERQLYIS